MDMNISILEVRFEHVARQRTPIRPGAPLWPCPGYEVFEDLPGGSIYVGFFPEAALPSLVEDYAHRAASINVGEPLTRRTQTINA